MGEAILVIEDGANGVVKFTASGALASGEIIRLPDGRAGVVLGLQAIASGEAYSAATRGRFAAPKASATLFAVGQMVYFDASANLAVTAPANADDFALGPCGKAAINGDTDVQVDLNALGSNPMARGLWKTPVHEFDHADDTTPVDLVPAALNPTGLIIFSASLLISEQPAGSEDQMVVVFEDSDGNDLATATTTDSSPDAAGDIVKATGTEVSASSGGALAIVPAGKGLRALLSQGSTDAGKAKAYAVVMPLI